MSKVSGMIAIPASLRSDFIHIPGTPIHIALESTIHITGIRTSSYSRHWKREAISGRSVPSSATDAERLAQTKTKHVKVPMIAPRPEDVGSIDGRWTPELIPRSEPCDGTA